MLDGYKHLASSIEETPEKQFASLDIKEKILALENSMVEEHKFNRETMIKDTSYGLINDIKIEGNTMINLAHGAVWLDSTSGGSTSKMSSDSLLLNVKDGEYCHVNCYSYDLGRSFFTTSVRLTVCFDITELPNNTSGAFFTFVDETGGYYSYNLTTGVKIGKQCLTIDINPKTAKRFTPRFFVNCMDTTGTSGRLKVINFCIFEGEVDPTTFDEYIRGVVAVGTDGNIKLSTCGRNMFNHNLPVVSDKITVIGENEYKTEAQWQTINHIVLSPNKKYYMSADLRTSHRNYPVRLNNIMRLDYTSRGSVVNYSEMPRETIPTLPTQYTRLNSGLLYIHNNKMYERVSVLMRNADLKPLYARDIMIQEVLTENDIVHEYEPYISSEANIKVNAQLHGLPNGVRDTIELIDGVYCIVRRCKEVRLKSYLNWTITQIQSSTVTRFTTTNIENVRAMRSEIRSNFVPRKHNNEEYVTPGIFTSSGLSENNTAFINVDIPNSLFNNASPTVEQFGQWLNNGDYRIIVELMSPVIEKIDNQEEFKKLLLFDGVTHIYGNGNLVYPLCTVKIPTNLCAELDSVESAISILEKEVRKMENVSLTSVMALIDRKEEIKNGVQTQD